MHVVFLQGICGFTYTRQSDFSVFRAAVFTLLELCVHLWLGADMKATSVYPSVFPCSVKEKRAKMLNVARELSPWAEVGGFSLKVVSVLPDRNVMGCGRFWSRTTAS